MTTPICHPTLIRSLIDCLREPWEGEETVSLWGIPVRVSSAQPPDLITLRSFRSDGSVLDQQHLKVSPKGRAAGLGGDLAGANGRRGDRGVDSAVRCGHHAITSGKNKKSAKGSHPGRSDNNQTGGM